MLRRMTLMRLFAPITLGLAIVTAQKVCEGQAKATPASEKAGQVLGAAGFQGGLIVHLGCGTGELTAALGASDRALVHGLDADPGQVHEAREHLRSRGLYGKVSVDRLRGRQLPYVDSSVNLVVSEDLGDVPMEEVMRVLCPGGTAYVKQEEAWTKTVKPRPREIDEWTHCLHAPDNNAVAHDSVVGPPHHIQWVGVPRSARQHERLASVSAVVSAGGRVFSIQDEGSVASVLLPSKWFLVARDAFNGVILWKRPVGPWADQLWNFRSGPPDLARRLVAVGARVYVTLGYGQPLSALDAATGKTVKTYEATEGTSEILYDDGVLYLVAGDVDAEQASALARRRGDPSPGSKRIVAIQADTGERLWEKSDGDTARLMPLTLAASGGRLFFQNTQEVLCLDAKTGKELWRASRPATPQRPPWSAPTLVVYGDVVLSADRAAPQEVKEEPGRKHKTSWIDAPAGRLVALSAETGRTLWTCECREGFHAPVDVLVAGGLVWTGEIAAAGDPGITVGRDPETGEIKRERPADKAFFEVGMPHHRCHRDRATDRYLVLSRAGVEFIDLASGRGIANHWVRGTCQHGPVPCNGLLYAPPHSCACYLQAKLNGFYALAPKRDEERGASVEGRRVSDERRGARSKGEGARDEAQDGRLERGLAFRATGDQPSISNLQSPISNLQSSISNLQSSISNLQSPWSTYRHDAARSGSTSAVLPATLKPGWQRDLGGRLSSLTMAGARVFVASIDEHTVYALDAKSGQTLWHYTAGGRVDSPPTIYQGLALFGSADGCVYALRASDGQLAWRFQAAPEDRRVVAYGQLESVWPVHGSVLVQDGVVWLAAGRSSYLDGGILLYRLDPETGRKLSETRLDSRDPKTGEQPQGIIQMFDTRGALPDVLSSDGTFVYMRHLKFDRQGTLQEEGGQHLFSPTGFLDDLWWHRSYWIFGSRFYTGYRDWFRAGREVPAGRMLAVDESGVYGFARKPEYYHWATPQQYQLVAVDKEPQIVKSPRPKPRVPDWGQHEVQYRWSHEIPLRAQAMVLAADTLFVAGPPDLVDEEEANRAGSQPDMQARLKEQDAALGGERGGRLWAVSAKDGAKLAEYPLAAPPVWGGMAAADGRLVLATQDGRVVCFGP